MDNFRFRKDVRLGMGMGIGMSTMSLRKEYEITKSIHSFIDFKIAFAEGYSWTGVPIVLDAWEGFPGFGFGQGLRHERRRQRKDFFPSSNSVDIRNDPTTVGRLSLLRDTWR